MLPCSSSWRRRNAKKDGKAQQARDAFYDSQPWLELRYAVLKKYGPVCMLCNRSRKDGVQIHVDHIKPRKHFPELELEFANLQVLCRECNLGKRAHDDTDWRDPNADAIAKAMNRLIGQTETSTKPHLEVRDGKVVYVR